MEQVARMGSADVNGEVTSLASQNKGGLLLALAGATLGCVMANPLLVLAGLAGGFLAGSVGIDGKVGVVSNFMGGRQGLGETDSLPGKVLPLGTAGVDTQARQALEVAVAGPKLHNVSFDPVASPACTPASAVPGAAMRTIRHHR